MCLCVYVCVYVCVFVYACLCLSVFVCVLVWIEREKREREKERERKRYRRRRGRRGNNSYIWCMACGVHGVCCWYADNTFVSCMNHSLPADERANCTKDWHHSWVHDCR